MRSAVTALVDIWSGVATPIGAVKLLDGSLLIAYYDPDRFVCLSLFGNDGALLRTRRLEERFGGWDAHNGLVLAQAKDGSVHLAGNAHVSPMMYAVSRSPAELDFVFSGSPVDGELHITYPRFCELADGRLLFYCRFGRSGAGYWVAWAWSGTEWNLLSKLFCELHDGQNLSAYPSPFLFAADGSMHVAIVWRRTADVRTNFAITYAWTKDFQIWHGAHGEMSQGPLAPSEGTMVEATGEGCGLLNKAKVHLNGQGVPLVAYHRYSFSDTNAICLAKAGSVGWDINEVAVSKTKVPLEGKGSIPDLPMQGFVEEDGKVLLAIYLPSKGKFMVNLDEPSSGLIGSRYAGRRPIPKNNDLIRAGAETVLSIQPIFINGYAGDFDGFLGWHAQKLNRDLPRQLYSATLSANASPSATVYYVPTE